MRWFDRIVLVLVTIVGWTTLALLALAVKAVAP